MKFLVQFGLVRFAPKEAVSKSQAWPYLIPYDPGTYQRANTLLKLRHKPH